ncbi:ribosomal protein L1 [Hortaea werneckii]|uniref:Ribosomal protein L1 n=1 Tax=Hortaea werneckii TaxID=91943 RepID=A0A3M7HL20_HORWE|nr:ribosomal protein L1 [Hortaea werneckii]KAI7572615.1 ribosomal protein L1 [Hortaea werneckii]KAI7616017.1 ribosomal protein L1 [Hortaea werneckii]KAI7623765.1 ribosomal protein L1 [Hortaea werneckii]KAI7661330.1 ribosomal protein L1 [Hortaea werneckii]
MAPINGKAVAKKSDSPYQLDNAQTLRASTALLKKIQSDEATSQKTTEKPSLLADADEADVEDETPVWMILTTKKHIVDKKRLKPGKIPLPHPYLDSNDESLRICLITADPQRRYKDLIEHPSFPVELGERVQRVLGLEKLKTKYKSFESRRQLLSEYDVFLADDRIITYLPGVLGKVFYKTGSKRPIPVSFEGKRQNVDEQGNKRRKLSEGGNKVSKTEVKPADVAHEIERALSSALVHLAPSTTTAVKVGKATMEPNALQENVETAVQTMVERYVPQQWRNVRSIHIKGPNTVALPIWLAEELWEKEEDVLDEPLPAKEKPAKKRKRSALAEAVEEPDTIEVPGPDGQMRQLENPAKPKKVESQVQEEEEVVLPTKTTSSKSSKKRKSEDGEAVALQAQEKAEKDARKESLKKQKEDAKKAAAPTVVNGNDKKKTTAAAKKQRVKAADLI